ncbi:MAG: TonB-dependent receptor, partial [Prevotella sp.]|nr:TonB-dependent receptor [Prevotella sp.]
MFKYILVNILLLCAFAETSAQGKKCLVEFSIIVTDSQGNPVSGTFSLSVTDAAVVKPDSVQPMLDSYMLLNSELKGNIENPNYYFKAPDRRTAHHLDLLMMTQGWRRYMLEDMVSGTYPDITYSIETGQTISGEVQGTMGNKVRNVNLHLVTPHIGRLDTIPLNDNRRFTITGLDFTDGTTFLLQ